MSFITAILVYEAPVTRPPTSARHSAGVAPGGGGTSTPAPSTVIALPYGVEAKLPKNVANFVFPETITSPWAYDHAASEFVFSLTPRDEPIVHGFCRRFRVGHAALDGRLDVAPFSAASATVAATPTVQAICILSERPYHKLFSQFLQLLHAARLAGGNVGYQLARALLSITHAPAGAVLPLRSLLLSSKIPGNLYLPREKLRVPPAIGLRYFDVPITPLLNRIDYQGLLMLYTAMLCERRIMFVAQSLSTLTSCVHAAIALLQPFDWQNIFIPVLPDTFLPYCCAPNPYIIGLTPAQFTSLNDEYEIGDIVLVALDEGYVACLNSSLPLVDLEGPTAANNNTGFISYSGPSFQLERSAAAVATASGGGVDVTASSPGSVGSLASGGGVASYKSLLVPFLTTSRTHAYDDEFVQARQDRKRFAAHRLDARRRGRESMWAHFNKDPVPYLKSSHAGGRRASVTGSGGVPTTPGTPGSSLPRDSGWASGGDDPSNVTIGRNGGGLFMSPTSTRALVAAATNSVSLTADGAATIAASARRSSMSEGELNIPPTSSASLANAAGVELDGSLAEDVGMTNLGVDLVALVSRPGDEEAVRKRTKAAARRIAALPAELAGLDLAAVSSKRTQGRTLAQKLALNKLGAIGSAWAAGMARAAGSSAVDCPGMRMAAEIKRVYDREKREGAYDEASLYAAVLAFVAVVFGRVPEFVHLDASATGGHAITANDCRFAKEEFVRFTVRHATVARLLDEAQHSQWLQVFSIDTYVRQTRPPPSPSTGAAPVNMVDVLLAEAAAGAATSGVASIGAGGSVGRSLSGSGSMSGLTSAGAALLGGGVAYASVFKRMVRELSPYVDPLTEVAVNPSPASSALPAATHTLGTLLAGLDYSSSCPAAVFGRPPTLSHMLPDASPGMVATALRALLVAATSTGPGPEEPLSVIHRLAAAATHDPYLIHVVMGVLWSRLNDCGDKNWQHGYKALNILVALLRAGSSRVMVLAISFLPLLRYFMHPTVIRAVRAGYVAEELAGQGPSVTYVLAANVVHRSRRGMFGGSGAPPSLPGLNISAAPNPLSTLTTAVGAAKLAQSASRVYRLLCHPKAWLRERALVAGPTAVTMGRPLPIPSPYPLVLSACTWAPGCCALPPGWMPTPAEPQPPIGAYQAAVATASAHPAAQLTGNVLSKQATAGSAPWAKVHTVSTPAMASCRSVALHSLARDTHLSVQTLCVRQAAVTAAIQAARRQKIQDSPASAAAAGLAATSAGGLFSMASLPVPAPRRVRSLRDALLQPVSSGARSSAAPAVILTGAPSRARTTSSSATGVAPPATVSKGFDDLFGAQTAAPARGSAAALPSVPSSEFDVFGPAPVAGNVGTVSTQRSTSTGVATFDFDSWTSGGSGAVGSVPNSPPLHSAGDAAAFAAAQVASRPASIVPATPLVAAAAFGEELIGFGGLGDAALPGTSSPAVDANESNAYATVGVSRSNMATSAPIVPDDLSVNSSPSSPSSPGDAATAAAAAAVAAASRAPTNRRPTVLNAFSQLNSAGSASTGVGGAAGGDMMSPAPFGAPARTSALLPPPATTTNEFDFAHSGEAAPLPSDDPFALPPVPVAAAAPRPSPATHLPSGQRVQEPAAQPTHAGAVLPAMATTSASPFDFVPASAPAPAAAPRPLAPSGFDAFGSPFDFGTTSPASSAVAPQPFVDPFAVAASSAGAGSGVGATKAASSTAAADPFSFDFGVGTAGSGSVSGPKPATAAYQDPFAF